jgi:hypothetical protein
MAQKQGDHRCHQRDQRDLTRLDMTQHREIENEPERRAENGEIDDGPGCPGRLR